MGLEPTTPCLQSRCSSQLSYVPVCSSMPRGRRVPDADTRCQRRRRRRPTIRAAIALTAGNARPVMSMTGRIFTPSGPTSATAIVRLRPRPPPPPPPPPPSLPPSDFPTPEPPPEPPDANVSMSGITVRSPTTVAGPTAPSPLPQALERSRYLLGATDKPDQPGHGRPLFPSVPRSSPPRSPPRCPRPPPPIVALTRRSPPEPRIPDVDPQDRQRRQHEHDHCAARRARRRRRTRTPPAIGPLTRPPRLRTPPP